MYVFCVYVGASVRVCFCEYTKIKFSRFSLEIFLSTKCFTFLLSQKKTTVIESQILIMLNMKTLDIRSQSPCIFFSILQLREKCPYLEFFRPAFFRIRTEYGQKRSISPYSVRILENRDQRNSEYEHFSHSVNFTKNYSDYSFIKLAILEHSI